MVRRIFRILIGLVGVLIGIGVTVLVYSIALNLGTDLNAMLDAGVHIIIFSAAALGGFFIFFWQSSHIINQALAITRWLEQGVSQYSLGELLLSACGLVFGLLVAYLLTPVIMGIPYVWLAISMTILTYVFLGYIGLFIAVRRRDELTWFSQRIHGRQGDHPHTGIPRPKVLDTSVIIDGRIFDICNAGFIEGPLVIPGFVLQELRHIADSPDTLKRNRGRRGLDILARIQKELDIEVIIDPTDFENIPEVDEKLLSLTHQLNGRVLTIDYNLNKVASVQGVDVLNINELANAIKPVMLPGEELRVQVVKDGKEAGQGVAYLDDGTMIVIDQGKRYMGQSCDVVVTSVLQTAAGRMIFARLGDAPLTDDDP